MQSYKKKLIYVPFWHSLFFVRKTWDMNLFISPQITRIITNFIAKGSKTRWLSINEMCLRIIYGDLC